ncbi:hypothetical protein Tco_0044520 [Tanacetum coccineum]
MEVKMTIKEVREESVKEWKTKVTTNEGIIIKFPGTFHGYKLATEEKWRRMKDRHSGDANVNNGIGGKWTWWEQ